MRIGILSDTHGLLRDEVVKALDGVDHIIHAGDIDRKEVIDSLESITPVTVVRGNADKDWAEHIPMTASIDLSGKRFYVIHNKAKIDSDLSGYDVIVYGIRINTAVLKIPDRYGSIRDAAEDDLRDTLADNSLNFR